MTRRLGIVAISLGAALLVITGCARSFSSRLSSAYSSGAASRYPTVQRCAPHLATYLAAIGEPPFESRDSAAPPALRLLELWDEPRYVIRRIEGVGDSAHATEHVEGQSIRSSPISKAAWAALLQTLTDVDVWKAPWRGAAVLDEVVYGFEIRQGNRHRALWLLAPEHDQANAGLIKLRAAMLAAMGIVEVRQ